MKQKAYKLLQSKRGELAIDFIFDAGAKIFLVVAIFAVMIYIMQCYNAAYVCRRVVRSIETSGEYNESNVQELVERLASADLDGVVIHVDAAYLSGTHHIQLRDDFVVSLTAEYPVTIAFIGSEPLQLRVPIGISMAGMSEVYWK